MQLPDHVIGNLLESALRHERAILVAGMIVLFMLAGLYTISGIGMNASALDMTGMAGMRDMPSQHGPRVWSAAYAVLVFLMWWVMMIAMMLPSVAPSILLYAALLRKSAAHLQTTVMASSFLAGYLTSWAAFSAVATVAQWWLERIGLVSATMMTLVDTTPGAIVLFLAGAYQFTRLKNACLSHCRSPAEFIARYRRPGIGGAFVMGAHHGVYCLGCCWFLMALLFVGGIMNLYWIVGLAAFVAAEKLAPYGVALSRAAGAVLMVRGVWVILT